jgi:hypothetical protein
MPTLLAAALAVGGLVGAATDLLQAQLNSPWLSLVNAESPWLAPAFAVGAAARRRRHAGVAGAVVCVVELSAYNAAAVARHIAINASVTTFWIVCAVLGGPLFGIAGRLWREAAGPTRGLGPALLGSVFLGEAAIVYAVYLRYYSSAVLFVVIGIALVALLGVHGRQHTRTAMWMLATLPSALLAELAFHLVYNQTVI